MKIQVAKYIAEFLAGNNVRDIFTVTGGGAMFLNDAFGHHEQINCIYNHHEQASAMAAESYARLTGRIAAVCVTSGPGGTNAITGVLGGWLDSIPMFIISGQVKREMTIGASNVPLRQLGDQEFPIINAVTCMTKYACMVTEASEIRYHMEKAWFLCQSGRKGPVWLDIPLDIQNSVVETDELIGFTVTSKEAEENPVYEISDTIKIIELIKNAKRPVIYAGSGIRLGGAKEEFLNCIETLKIPVVTEWNANDLLWDTHHLFCGRQGTLGTRGGNFVVQNCDLLISLGSRLNVRQVGYNYKEFAKDAYIIMVDIDKGELAKPTLKVDFPIWADVMKVMKSINEMLCGVDDNKRRDLLGDHENWLNLARDINSRYPVILESYFKKNKPINPYVFIHKLFHLLEEGSTVVCGNGSACVIPFQVAQIKRNQRIYTNSGCAAMGYGFPAAIGACIASRGERIVCIDGDGSFQMNIQELQTVVYHQLNLKIVILNNNGYHSIRQTQTNIFKSSLVGVCDGNGLSFPDVEKIATAYGVPYVRVDSLLLADQQIVDALATAGPIIIEAIVDPSQNFEPKLLSRTLENGTIVSPTLDDMFPFLQKDEYSAIRAECQRLS